MAQKKEQTSGASLKNVGIGVGLTATALSAVGAYFLYGSNRASQNRKKVKGWMLKAKGEVLEALENADSITEKEYKELLSTVTNACSTLKNVSKGELRDFKSEMTDHWASLQKSAAVKKVIGTKSVAKAGTKSASTNVKKVASKTAPKKIVSGVKKTASAKSKSKAG